MAENNRFFSSDQREEIRYAETLLRESSFLEECRQVLAAQTVPERRSGKPDEEHIWQSLIFSMATQANSFEDASELVKKLENGSVDQLRDPHYVHQQTSRLKAFTESRVTKVWNFAKKYTRNIQGLANDLLRHPADVRKFLVDRKIGLDARAISLWHTCLGGTTLMTLNQQSLQQLAGLGMDIDPRYHTPCANGEGAQASLSQRTYTSLESQALRLLIPLPEFEAGDKVNAALASTTFWWAGVLASHGYDPQTKTGTRVTFKPLYQDDDMPFS